MFYIYYLTILPIWQYANVLINQQTIKNMPQNNEIDPKLLEFLVCPITKGPLIYDRESHELISKKAGLAYPIRGGIPIMLEDEARKIN